MTTLLSTLVVALFAGCLGMEDPEQEDVAAPERSSDSYESLADLVAGAADAPSGYEFVVDEDEGDDLLDIFHMEGNPAVADEDLFASFSEGPEQAYGAMLWGARAEDGALATLALGFRSSRTATTWLEERDRCENAQVLSQGAQLVVVGWVEGDAFASGRYTIFASDDPISDLLSTPQGAAAEALADLVQALQDRTGGQPRCEVKEVLADGNDEATEAVPLTVGPNPAASISGDTDTDWYSFTMDSEGFVRVSVDAARYLNVQVTDDFERNVRTSSMPGPTPGTDKSGTHLLARVPSGNYLVSVSSSDEVDRYVVTLAFPTDAEAYWDDDNVPATATALAEGMSDTFELSPHYDIDHYRIEVNRAGELEVSAGDGSSFSAVYQATLLDPAGQVVWGPDLLGEEFFGTIHTIQMPVAAGSYVLRIESAPDEYETSYKLTVVLR